MGYDGLFFGRVDYQDKFNRAITKSMEMVWQGSPNNLGTDDKERNILDYATVSLLKYWLVQ